MRKHSCCALQAPNGPRAEKEGNTAHTTRHTRGSPVTPSPPSETVGAGGDTDGPC